MINTHKILLMLLMVWYSNVAFATKFSHDSLNEQLAYIVPHANSIFVGKVLSKKIIKNGLVSAEKTGKKVVKVKHVRQNAGKTGLVSDIGIWTIQVQKVYRGALKVGDKQTICTEIMYPDQRYSLTEIIYTKPGAAYTFFGVKAGQHVYIPFHLGELMQPKGYEQEISQALNLPTRFKQQRQPIHIFYDQQKLLKDACRDKNSD